MAYLYWFLIIERNGKLFIKIDSTLNKNLSNEIKGKVLYNESFYLNKEIVDLKNDKTNISLNIDQDENEVTPEYLYRKFVNFFDDFLRGIKKELKDGFDDFMKEEILDCWNKFKNLSPDDYNKVSGLFLTDTFVPRLKQNEPRNSKNKSI